MSLGMVFCPIVILNLAVLIVRKPSSPLYTLVLSISPYCSSLPHPHEIPARRTMY